MPKSFFSLFLLLCLVSSGGSSANESVLFIPPNSGTLETTLFLPKGDGPFPLVVINHGKGDFEARKHQRFRAEHASEFFTSLGYAVALPMREGFSKSEGWERSYACDMEKTGKEQAKSIRSAVDFLTKQPFIDNSRVIIVGYSYGGFASLAYASEFPFKNIKAIINFSGGVSRRGGGCIWTEELLEAMAKYGENTPIPSLWIYSENDKLFPEWLAKGMHLRYKLAGGNSALLLTEPYSHDGHNLFIDPKAGELWEDVVKFFLSKI